jgi:NAD(P)-dependent dehydrogenase (short-subunit alcohol dehydrogenase family)
VTGGAQGLIGRAVAERFAAERREVAIWDVDGDLAAQGREPRSAARRRALAST